MAQSSSSVQSSNMFELLKDNDSGDSASQTAGIGLKVQCTSIYAYNGLKDALKKNKLRFFSHDFKPEQRKSYVISGLPNLPDMEKIISDELRQVYETWLSSRQNLDIPAYRIVRLDRASGKGGGVAIVLKSHINFEIVQDMKLKVIEAVGIKFGSLKKVTLVAAYFPGTALSRDKHSNFKSDINYLSRFKGNFIIAGDFNSKHRHWNCVRANKSGQILYDGMINGNFFVFYPPTPTFFPHQANRSLPSTIDLLLTNNPDLIGPINSLNKLSSDHLPVSFQLLLSLENNSGNKCLIPQLNKVNWSQFQRKMDLGLKGMENLEEKCDPEYIDEVINKFNVITQNVSKECIPMVSQNRKSKPLPVNIRKLIAQKNYIRNLWFRHRSQIYKCHLNVLTRKIRDELRIFRNQEWENRLQKAQENSQQFWRITRNLKKKKDIIPPFKNNTEVVTDDIGKANLLKDQFYKAHTTTMSFNSSEELKSKISSSLNLFNYLKPAKQEMYSLEMSEIKQIVKSLKKRKAPGADAIYPIMIKNFPPIALEWLFAIFGLCMSIGYFPRAWKQAVVVPVPKPGKDHSLASSYRPISLLSTLGKIFEKIILKRLDHFISVNNIIRDEQFGFRRGHSTTHQLVRISSSIKKGLSQKRSTGMVIFDIEKCFDTIWHDAVVYKMLCLKFPSYICKLIQSFLRDRSFAVRMGSAISAPSDIPYGLPQGSALSPTLFNIFTHDLPSVFKRCYSSLFADDTALLYTDSSIIKI
uniref:Putative reverse transcriptase-like protein n=1 Tax=Lutzomyia longipalpis TaxID=7200 RepID=A0A1B0CHA5_LUTLO